MDKHQEGKLKRRIKRSKYKRKRCQKRAKVIEGMLINYTHLELTQGMKGLGWKGKNSIPGKIKINKVDLLTGI